VKRSIGILLLAILIGLMVAIPILARGIAGWPVRIPWHTVAGGGGSSAGGAFSVSGSIGQVDAGPPLVGGDYGLSGGFWTGREAEVQPTTIYLPLVARDHVHAPALVVESIQAGGGGLELVITNQGAAAVLASEAGNRKRNRGGLTVSSMIGHSWPGSRWVV
jgi:hypothetical protein